jgi:hypothetical protein
MPQAPRGSTCARPWFLSSCVFPSLRLRSALSSSTTLRKRIHIRSHHSRGQPSQNSPVLVGLLACRCLERPPSVFRSSPASLHPSPSGCRAWGLVSMCNRAAVTRNSSDVPVSSCQSPPLTWLRLLHVAWLVHQPALNSEHG